jgi:hypothetical protein
MGAFDVNQSGYNEYQPNSMRNDLNRKNSKILNMVEPVHSYSLTFISIPSHSTGFSLGFMREPKVNQTSSFEV